MKSPQKEVINRDIKTSMNILLCSDDPSKEKKEDYKFRRVICGSSELICRQLEVIGWRFKTSLPIIKPIFYKMMQFPQNKASFHSGDLRSLITDSPKKSKNSQIDTKILIQFVRNNTKLQKYTVQVVIEKIFAKLSDVGFLPFAQIIYLLKEMMIGYDVLLDIFGTFEPNDQMVAVDENYQWRVWINEDYTINIKNDKSANLGEKQFIYKLIFIAERHCTPTNISRLFFTEIKQFTYNKDCTFIKILQKIKEFTNANKIFQCNKVTIAPDKKINESITFDMEQKRNFIPSNNLNSSKYQKKAKPFLKNCLQGGGMGNAQVKSSVNLFGSERYNRSMMINNNSINANPHGKDMNTSTIEYTKKTSNIFMQNKPLSNIMSQFLPSKFNYRSSDTKKPQLNQSITINTNPQKSFNIYPPAIKPSSPQHFLNRQKTSFLNLSKSRHQLKELMNPKPSKSPEPVILNQKFIPEEKIPPKKSTRKYSEQILKVKSLQALGSKKITGSNIYLNDPENKILVNVIKSPQLKLVHSQQSPQGQDRKMLSPNDSSPSTKQVKNSKQDSRRSDKDNYLSMKINDLEGKLRNNQSSYYGMGGRGQQKRQKNMAVSYSFNNHNREEVESKSSQKSQNKGNNNWMKKLSGLFSDDASIKHLKESVKFKTKQEEFYEKEYLKDVKLDMLQKFGRPVRHSIVDEQDDFEDYRANKLPHQSMQLIEQIFDDGKSHMQKQEEEEEMPLKNIRKRNQTVQIICNPKQQIKQRGPVKKQCISEYCQSEEVNSQDGFNFETQQYVINGVK